MALYYDLPVYKDTYRFIVLLFEAVRNFSRDYRYTLGQDMQKDALKLVRYIYRANIAENKTTALADFTETFEVLKTELRLAFDLQQISHKSEAELKTLANNIGKQISGWKKKTGIIPE